MSTSELLNEETRNFSRRGLLRFVAAGVAAAALGDKALAAATAREREPGDDHGGHGGRGDDHGRRQHRHGRNHQ